MLGKFFADFSVKPTNTLKNGLNFKLSESYSHTKCVVQMWSE